MFKKLLKSIQDIKDTIKQKIENVDSFSYLKKLPKEMIFHAQNIAILLVSYIVISAAIYSELSLVKCSKEIFSLLCMYGAIFIWFVEKITASNAYRVLIGVTAIFAPIIFINSSLGVAIVSILCFIVLEYVAYKYIGGCNLFSALIPVYVVCSNRAQVKELKSKLSSKFKIIGFVLTNDTELKCEEGEIDVDRFNFDDLERQLSKLSRLFFLPYPRKILCLQSDINTEQFAKLCSICTKFSIKLFKISILSNDKKHHDVSILPISNQDVITEINFAQLKQKTALNAAFKNSRVWIFFDDTEIVANLIQAISTVSSVDLTVFCNSSQSSDNLYEKLTKKYKISNYKIKIADADMLSLQDSKPDIIFYNMPIKGHVISEYSLKEILVKNVISTQDLIEYAQNMRVKHVFIFSGTDAANASNWIGATQRLGELIAQHADVKSKKSFTKFKVIRIPLYLSSEFEVFSSITTSILSTGNAIFRKDKLPHIYCDDTIFKSLLKLIFMMLKEDDPYYSVYTISAGLDETRVNELVEKAESMLGITESVKIVYENDDSEQMDLENFPNIQEEFEETDIPCVTRTKLLPSTEKVHNEETLSIESIRNMNTRELISFVFQAISDKKHK